MPGRLDLVAERQELIGRAHRSRYRLHRRPELLRQLKQATNELLRAELAPAETPKEPLGLIEDDEEPRDPLRWWDR
ncbi:hypothetical protein C8N35_102111 [Breoghania corrubedonensis]|uniref:Uncharacterized protein n=1 Tax=Breoghania corrubedonensis TaxID=665038 RepID=A0A2T5VCD2_9HYPH|nr:hypothetical protein [Breoghania corrubedonensis]PTW61402.1 hypothetical protein C8N35_102111 [Breoghania corrubedonensis]